jgi:hypothetical protein
MGASLKKQAFIINKKEGLKSPNKTSKYNFIFKRKF